jgi:hypothetical protein
MTLPTRRLPLIALLAGVGHAAAGGVPPQADDHSVLALTAAQQRAVGVRIDHPIETASPPQIEAHGLVLDPVTLVADAGRVDSSQAALHSAVADVARLEGLYHDNGNVSLKALQAAQTAQAEAAAQARVATTTFAMQWGPVATVSASRRRALIDAVSAGRHILVRADLPGRLAAGAIARRALIEADGIGIDAQVLGSLPRTDPQLRSAGWLLEVDRRPEGLGPGTHVRVRLQRASVRGLLVPAVALLYGARGAYVYRQVGEGGAAERHYEAVPVKLLTAVGDGWLVAGLTSTDSIVVQGAGVLWSLQGINTFSAAEAEHD